MALTGLVAGPDWVAPLLAAVVGMVVLRAPAPLIEPLPKVEPLAPTEPRDPEHAALVSLFRDLARSADDDATRVDAALADIRFRANQAGPQAWSDEATPLV